MRLAIAPDAPPKARKPVERTETRLALALGLRHSRAGNWERGIMAVAQRAKALGGPAQRAERAAFLNVTSSARGLLWRERLEPGQANLATTISQRHGLPELLGRVLAARGFTVDEVPVVLEPTIRALLPDPSTFRDMDNAACRLADAILARESIAIFGDYDVDGAASSALLARFLGHHGLSARIYIPDRLVEGYGPNASAIEGLIRDGARLIVTVDCGTTSHEPLAVAAGLNTDVIVIDHHQADERLPAVVALVNPNRQDDLSGQGHLCAAGVVFLVLVATQRELRRRGAYAETAAAGGGKAPSAHTEPALIEELDLVALATVADVVPLKGVNRAFVAQGLKIMHRRRNIGLRALADAAGFDAPPTPYHLGFILGPRINAGGRIGDAGLGARLLSTGEPMEAARIAVLLDKLNKERKTIETAMLADATAAAEHLVEDNPDLAMIVLASHEWHKGIVGLVASRLVERFQRPACVIAWEGAGQAEGKSGRPHLGTGSLRSVAGVDIGSAVRAAVAEKLLLKGGGHAMAAGLTLTSDAFEPLRAFLADKVRQPLSAIAARATLDIDGALTPAGATDALVDLLERAGPYGQGNPQPRFAFPTVRVRFAKVVGEAHVRCVLEGGDGARIEAIAFRAAGQPVGALLMAAGGMPIHVCGHIKRDSWGGRVKIDMMIDDVAPLGRSGD